MSKRRDHLSLVGEAATPELQERADRAVEKAARKAAADRTEASWKLDLWKSSNADPRLTGSDRLLLGGYVFAMEWPKRSAWLVNSHAQSSGALSKAQVSFSRKNLVELGYLVPLGWRKSKTTGRRIPVFGVENPQELDLLDHVQDESDRLRAVEAERIAKRRKKQLQSPESRPPAAELVTKIKATEEPMSPQKIAHVALKTRTDSPFSSLKEDSLEGGMGDRAVNGAVPGTQAASQIEELIAGHSRPSDAVRAFWLQKAQAGKLTADIVEAHYEALGELPPPPRRIDLADARAAWLRDLRAWDAFAAEAILLYLDPTGPLGRDASVAEQFRAGDGVRLIIGALRARAFGLHPPHRPGLSAAVYGAPLMDSLRHADLRPDAKALPSPRIDLAFYAEQERQQSARAARAAREAARALAAGQGDLFNFDNGRTMQ